MRTGQNMRPVTAVLRHGGACSLGQPIHSEACAIHEPTPSIGFLVPPPEPRLDRKAERFELYHVLYFLWC
jgi:hypothetical protein